MNVGEECEKGGKITCHDNPGQCFYLLLVGPWISLTVIVPLCRFLLFLGLLGALFVQALLKVIPRMRRRKESEAYESDGKGLLVVPFPTLT